MSVILLDARFPDVFPLGAFGLTGAEVTYTSEVPISVRWALIDLFHTAPEETDADVLITTDVDNPQTQQWLNEGHQLLEVPTARIVDQSEAGGESDTLDGESNLDTGLADGDLALPHVAEAVKVMRAACTRGEWEAKQTHQSLLPYLSEEVEEFIEAVEAYTRAVEADAGDNAGDGASLGASSGLEQAEKALKEELSDVLLQVLFHADIASRRGTWDLDDVAHAFVEKIRSREPFLFDGSTGMVSEAEQERLWQAGKQAEQATQDPQ